MNETGDDVQALIAWLDRQYFGDQGLRLKMEQVSRVLKAQCARVRELEHEVARLIDL